MSLNDINSLSHTKLTLILLLCFWTLVKSVYILYIFIYNVYVNPNSELNKLSPTSCAEKTDWAKRAAP